MGDTEYFKQIQLTCDNTDNFHCKFVNHKEQKTLDKQIDIVKFCFTNYRTASKKFAITKVKQRNNQQPIKIFKSCFALQNKK